MAKKLLVEGWRGINHSYAMVNQYQLLELQKLDIELFHNDLPFVNKAWNQQKNFCGFAPEAVEKINSIQSMDKVALADVTYRIGFPYRLYPANSSRLFVFGTSEYQTITGDMVFQAGDVIDYKKLPVTVITPSNWSKIGFINAGFRDEQVQVIPHGVDLDIFRPLNTDLRERYRSLVGADKDSFVILSVGAMTKNKGIDVLLSAYIELKKKHPQLRLVLKDQSNLYGFSANDLLNLYCRERNLNLTSAEVQNIISGIVLVSENLNLIQLNGLYNAADCYVSPYRAEGFNLPPLEAAAAGVPIIVTKGGSTDDYVDESFALTIESDSKHENHQYYFEPKLESLIDQLTTLIEKRDTRLHAEQARELISQKLSWAAISSELAKQMDLI